MHPPNKEAQLPAKFQLRKGPTGKFRFVVLSSNGQVVATSEAYERKASALAGIKSIEKIVQSNATVEDTTTREYAEAEAAKKAKKAGAKKTAKKATSAAKKVVTKASGSTSGGTKKAAPKKAGGRAPVRKAPPPHTIAPENLTPKL